MLSNNISKINDALTINKLEDFTFTIISKKKVDLKLAIETFIDGIKGNNEILQIIDKLFMVSSPSNTKINKNSLFKDIDFFNFSELL